MSDLGLYIHVPFCRHACPYCDFYKIELRDQPARSRLEFTDDIARELDLLLGLQPELSTRPLATIYFGGGTPSTLSPPGVARLLGLIRSHFPGSEKAVELTLEANPENMTERRCEAWRDAGFTRVSMGVQSFDSGELQLLERLHEPLTIERAVAAARRAGLDNISLDLMFALPGQRLDGWLSNLRRALDLGPDHLSFYGLTWHEGTPFASQLERGLLRESPETLQEEMYRAGAELLEAHGFEHYEISNFARSGRRSRHNQRYWTRADVLGLGPGAHSNVSQARWRNPDDLDGWRARIRAGELAREGVEELDPASALGERLFTHLRRREGISRSHDPALHRLMMTWLASQPAEARDWVQADGERFALTRSGWLVSDAIVESALRLAPLLPQAKG